MPICPNCPSLLSTPSSVKLLLVGRAPLTTRTEPPDSRKRVDSVEPPLPMTPPGEPPDSKPPPPPRVVTKGRVTPGESVASSVQLRCGIGGSVTVPTIVPLLLWAAAGNAKAAAHKSAAAHLGKRVVRLSIFMSEPRMVKGCMTTFLPYSQGRSRRGPARS